MYEDNWSKLRACSGILMPGGFGSRGVDGMISAVRHARENRVPFFGICLGLQISVIEAARNQLKLTGASSEEFVTGGLQHNVVVFMPEGSKEVMGGTMRLGKRMSVLTREPCIARAVYGCEQLWERHRHRYEVNPEYKEKLRSVGLVFSGTNSDGLQERLEIVERPTSEHPFFFAVQYHPEFKSRVLAPSPPFTAFLKASHGEQLREQPMTSGPITTWD
jgi:CTP synthase